MPVVERRAVVLAVAFVQKPYRTGELARALAAGGEPDARVL